MLGSFDIHGNFHDISTELDKINEWLTVNKLSVNIGKSKYMLFHSPQKSPKIIFKER